MVYEIRRKVGQSWVGGGGAFDRANIRGEMTQGFGHLVDTGRSWSGRSRSPGP